MPPQPPSSRSPPRSPSSSPTSPCAKTWTPPRSRCPTIRTRSSTPSPRPTPTPSSCSKPAAPSACPGSITSKASSRCGTPASAGPRRSRTSSSARSIPPANSPSPSPKTTQQLPHPVVPGLEGVNRRMRRTDEHKVKPFDLNYTEGAKVGYKWFEATNKQPLFPFGFGLSYTTYAYSGLTVDDAQPHRPLHRSQHRPMRRNRDRPGLRCASVRSQRKLQTPRGVAARETGSRPIQGSNSHPCIRSTLNVFNTDQNGWQLLPGDYTVTAGPSSSDTPLKATLHVHP